MYIYLFLEGQDNIHYHLSPQVAQTNDLHIVEVQYVFFLFNEPELFPEWVCVPTNIQVIDVIIKVINTPQRPFSFQSICQNQWSLRILGNWRLASVQCPPPVTDPNAVIVYRRPAMYLAPHSSQGKLCLCPVRFEEQGWVGKEDK